MDSKESLKRSVANGEGNSNLTTHSSIFNLILKTRVIEPFLITYYDSISWCLGQITIVYSRSFSQCNCVFVLENKGSIWEVQKFFFL